MLDWLWNFYVHTNKEYWFTLDFLTFSGHCSCSRELGKQVVNTGEKLWGWYKGSKASKEHSNSIYDKHQASQASQANRHENSGQYWWEIVYLFPISKYINGNTTSQCSLCYHNGSETQINCNIHNVLFTTCPHFLTYNCPN